MIDLTSIENTIKRLVNNDLSADVIGMMTLAASGSSRLYFRIFTADKTYIATYSTNIEENNAFLIFSKHFRNKGLPVPEILAINDEMNCYIQSDFGDVSLFDYEKQCIKKPS